jgi:hypothetical protein
VLSKQDQARSDLQGIINRLDCISRFSFSVKSPPSQKGSPSNSSVPSSNSTSWELWCWTFICLACSFAALFIATACYSLWISSSKPILEPICVQINQNFLHNAESISSTKNVTVPTTKEFISILSQNENETVIIMPYDGSVVDDLGNVYSLKGPFELKCDDYITFNYVTGLHVWHGDKCCKDPSFPNWPHRNGSATVEEYHLNVRVIFIVVLLIDVTLCQYNFSCVNGLKLVLILQ